MLLLGEVMKKKKLKQRIAELESQLVMEKLRVGSWKGISRRLINKLNEHGVKTEINFAEPTVAEVSRVEDAEEKYIHGINIEPLTLSFDFTEHDKEIIEEQKRNKVDRNKSYEWNLPGLRSAMEKQEKIYD